MAKCFPKLMQTHVRIDGYGGEAFNCPMLPVSAKRTLDECGAAFETVKGAEEFEAVKLRLVELCRTVVPEPYAGKLDRLPVETLIELVAYLMYGDGDDEPVREEEGENPTAAGGRSITTSSPAGS